MGEQGGHWEKLGNVIADPTLRDAFSTDPDGTLEGQGVDKGAIPDEVLDTLRELSPEELRLLGRFREPLQRAVDQGADPGAVLKMV